MKAKLSTEQQELSGFGEIKGKGANQLWQLAVWGGYVLFTRNWTETSISFSESLN